MIWNYLGKYEKLAIFLIWHAEKDELLWPTRFIDQSHNVKNCCSIQTNTVKKCCQVAKLKFKLAPIKSVILQKTFLVQSEFLPLGFLKL